MSKTERSSERCKRCRGNAMLELAIAVPVIVLMFAGAVPAAVLALIMDWLLFLCFPVCFYTFFFGERRKFRIIRKEVMQP